MKVSGAEQVRISGGGSFEIRLNEDVEIQKTVNRLSQEGKTVINIIHGTAMTHAFGAGQTITFLWEADDEDPRYKAWVAKEKAAKEREQKAEREKAAQKLDNERCRKRVEELEKRIAAAKKEKMQAVDKETVSRELKKGKAKGIIKTVLWVILVLVGSVIGESIVPVLILGVLGIVWLFLNALGPTPPTDNDVCVEAEIRKRKTMNYRLSYDKEHLPELEAELAEAKKKLGWLYNT